MRRPIPNALKIALCTFLVGNNQTARFQSRDLLCDCCERLVVEDAVAHYGAPK